MFFFLDLVSNWLKDFVGLVVFTRGHKIFDVLVKLDKQSQSVSLEQERPWSRNYFLDLPEAPGLKLQVQVLGSSPEFLQDHGAVVGADQQLPQVHVIARGVKGHLVSLHVAGCRVPGDPEAGLAGLRGLKVPRSLEARHWKQREPEQNFRRNLTRVHRIIIIHLLMIPQH